MAFQEIQTGSADNSQEQTTPAPEQLSADERLELEEQLREGKIKVSELVTKFGEKDFERLMNQAREDSRNVMHRNTEIFNRAGDKIDDSQRWQMLDKEEFPQADQNKHLEDVLRKLRDFRVSQDFDNQEGMAKAWKAMTNNDVFTIKRALKLKTLGENTRELLQALQPALAAEAQLNYPQMYQRQEEEYNANISEKERQQDRQEELAARDAEQFAEANRRAELAKEIEESGAETAEQLEDLRKQIETMGQDQSAEGEKNLTEEAVVNSLIGIDKESALEELNKLKASGDQGKLAAVLENILELKRSADNGYIEAGAGYPGKWSMQSERTLFLDTLAEMKQKRPDLQAAISKKISYRLNCKKF